MASFSELDLRSRLFMMTYRYQRYDDTPHTPLQLPLSACRVALVTTAGFYLPTQTPFDGSLNGGDCSYREIPNTVETRRFVIGHRSGAYDTSDTALDANLVFPLDRFRELETEGTIGTLNHRHFSFMGAITKPTQLIQETAPAVGELLKSDAVDVVFLTPV